MRKIKVVFDTNIFVSIFVFPGGVPEEVFKLVVYRDVELGVSDEIVDEFKRIMKEKFYCTNNKLSEILNLIKNNSTNVIPEKKINIIKDKADNKILECAEKFKSDFIISGDKHIVSVKKYKNIKILTVREFLNFYPQKLL